jgi:multimeric flavodoxin WrbA
MVKVSIIYYTRSGRTQALADAIAEGVSRVDGAEASAKRVDYATFYDLVEADAVAFGSPNYFSYMAGPLKDFFDKGLGLRDKTSGKPAAAFTSGGGGSDTALQSIERLIGSYKLEKVADGVVSAGEPTEEDLEKCKILGEKLAKAAKA